MSYRGLKLRHLCFLSEQKEAAYIDFGDELNVICGASDTGKSFIALSIDFMLGAKPPLKDIRERDGYDRILMGIEAHDGTTLTLERSIEGGDFLLYNELLTNFPNRSDGKLLKQKHNEKNIDNLSHYLLDLIGLNNCRVIKNKHGIKKSLSFRNLARLALIQEQEIIKEQSPILSGQYIERTLEYSVFKLLLTGNDDSAFISNELQNKDKLDISARVDLINQLIAEYQNELEELTDDSDDLNDQLERLDESITTHQKTLYITEQEINSLISQHRKMINERENIINRLDEIEGLIARFSLLGEHYKSDIDRLEAIHESGVFFAHLNPVACPICGARIHDQAHNGICDGDVNAVINAATAEIIKIRRLRCELDFTVTKLFEEESQLKDESNKIADQVSKLQTSIDEVVSSKVTEARATFSDLVEKRSDVREAINLLQRIQELEELRVTIENKGKCESDDVRATFISKNVLDDFSITIQDTLKTWHFPGAERVYFDDSSKDLVISGDMRSNHGKGLRAITHAAFNIALLEYCYKNDLAHPGFVLLDSPLLTYREPSSDEDNLQGSDLKNHFYEHLANLAKNIQIIIIENEQPPEYLRDRIKYHFFTGIPNKGRQGFFPIHQ